MKNFWNNLKKPILALAPMAGVTDIAFRGMCKHFGADVIYTEFASSEALVYKSKKTIEMIRFKDSERPVVVQIFGKNPKIMAQAAKICEDLGFDGVDINFGCPAYKVVKHGGGVNLMRNPKLCQEITQAIIEAVKIPVSIKIRSSIKKELTNAKKLERKSIPKLSSQLKSNYKITNNKDSFTAIDLIKEINKKPPAAIMIHARSYEQPFDGYPQIEIVKELRKLYSGILLHNGGVYTPEIAKELLEQTKADGLGIARGAWGKPWLFEQIKDYLKTGQYKKYSETEIKNFILDHAQLALEQKGEHGLIELRKHLSWYVKGWPGAKKLKDKLVRTSTLKEIKQILF